MTGTGATIHPQVTGSSSSQTSHAPGLRAAHDSASLRPATESGGNWWGWVENTAQNDSYGFDEVAATMVVPPQPTTGQGQLFYFPGLTSSNSGNLAVCGGILQPILFYSPGGQAGFPVKGWWIISEYVDPRGGSLNSGYTGVNVGDSIETSMYIEGSYVSGGVTYYTWVVDAYDSNLNASQLITGNFPCIFDQSYPAAFEVGNGAISSCSNVPNNYIDFIEISLYDSTPNWASYRPVSYAPGNNLPNQAPNCGFNIGNGYYSGYGNVTTLWQ